MWLSETVSHPASFLKMKMQLSLLSFFYFASFITADAIIKQDGSPEHSGTHPSSTISYTYMDDDVMKAGGGSGLFRSSRRAPRSLKREVSPVAPKKRDKGAGGPGKDGAGLYHYPYRPKFPAHPELGMCQLEDFKFTEEDKLGRGGFGNVYKALHMPTGKTVAIKVIQAKSIKEKPKHVENEETIHRILIHPNIGRLFCTMAEPNNNILFVLEYFPGGNFSKQLQANYPLPRPLFVKYVAQILLALRFMHENCIAYRDLKGENIMLDEEDNVRLIDLGLAVYDCKKKLNNVAGTLEFLAPEVAGRRSYGRASDYFSLGVLMHLIQMRRLPYRHKKDDKSKFLRLLGEGKLKIKPTGDEMVDSMISILTDSDQDRRWKNVYENFETLKRHPFFESFDWDYYEDVRFWQLS